MNQFDALLSQISELEGVNRESERKYLSLSQHTTAIEKELAQVRATLSATQEREAELREKVGALTVEKETEQKLSQRLKTQNTQLKNADHIRSKSMEEERSTIAALKKRLASQLEENNKVVREALAKLYNLPGLSKENPSLIQSNDVDPKSNSSNDTETKIDSNVVPDTSTNEATDCVVIQNASKMEELHKEINDLKSRLAESDLERQKSDEKLEESLAMALAEYNSLDVYSKQIQAQFDEIHIWYEKFEQWNRNAMCEQCGAKIDVATIIDAMVASETNCTSESSKLVNGSNE